LEVRTSRLACPIPHNCAANVHEALLNARGWILGAKPVKAVHTHVAVLCGCIATWPSARSISQRPVLVCRSSVHWKSAQAWKPLYPRRLRPWHANRLLSRALCCCCSCGASRTSVGWERCDNVLLHLFTSTTCLRALAPIVGPATLAIFLLLVALEVPLTPASMVLNCVATWACVA